MDSVRLRGWDGGASSVLGRDSAGAGVALPATGVGCEGEEGTEAVSLKQFPMTIQEFGRR
jgi:hypothetical protein